MLRPLLDVLFPRPCAGCGGSGWPFCSQCLLAVVPLVPPGCRRCGRPFDASVDRCRDCPPSPIGHLRAAFLFGGPVRRALHRLKFSGWRTVAEALGRSLAASAEPYTREADVVTWVPLSPSRRATRGFDQARALAVVAGRALSVPARPLLIRTMDTPPQARRSAAERHRAMRDAFRATGRAPPGLVVLVDDVVTTGATAAACAEVLLDAGAGEVLVLAAARALNGRLPARCYTRADSRPSLWLPGNRSR